MPKLLLVSPKFDSEVSRAREKVGIAASRMIMGSLMTPLHLATIAAMTPDEWEVDLWDEGAKDDITETTDLGKDYDLVATTAYIAQIPRTVEIARLFRKRGVPVAIGGPGVSGNPEQCRQEFDVMFLGEAEYTWQRFLKEFQHKNHRREYRQVDRPDLSHTPLPRWELIKDDVKRYRLAGVQTTRGCPFDCDFCDVIHLFGRKPRHRPIDRVLEEVNLLHKYGASRVFFCDDDFIGDFKYTRDLLKELVPLNNSFDAPMSFTTQLTIDLAKHEDIMALMADANFGQIFIGIETPRKASLDECNKVQNLQRDLKDDIRKIQSYGLIVKAGLIVGFDHDDKDVFQEQMDLIEGANITCTSINSIKTYPGTPQWVRMQREGRVLDVSAIYQDAPKVVTNIEPKNMTMRELLEGYSWLLERARSWDSFKLRVKGLLDGVTYTPNTKPPDQAARMERAAEARAGMASMDPEVRQHIAETIQMVLTTKPHMLERVGGSLIQMLMDWNTLPFHKSVIQKQIEMYEAGMFEPDRDPSAGMIPASFEKDVKSVMPLIYRRLSAEMIHKPAVPEAFVDIMKDFLIRWGKGFQGFEDFHLVYVNELCDRHVGRWNERRPEGGDDNALAITEEQASHFKFIREMLVAVEQELRGEVRAQIRPELVHLHPVGSGQVAVS